MIAVDISREQALHKLAKNLKAGDTASWRAFVEDGERQFCGHEMSMLKRFIRRMTGIHNKLKFPARFTRDRSTATNLWNNYIEVRQTPAQAAERVRSLETYKATGPAASLNTARKQLNERIESDPGMRAYAQKQQDNDENLKNFDFAGDRLQKGKVYREGPLRPGRRGQFPLQLTKTKSVRRIHLKSPHVANKMKVDEVQVSSCFAVSIATPKRTSDLLRNDPNLGKHMVKRGKESPLRQSVTLRVFSGFEREIEYMEENRDWDIEDLKKEVAKFERKNFACRTRHKVPSHPRSKISQICGR
ncbi:hypothetical protein F5882DRAFT_383017 [Hyaloscypha sp. PMI_1271]|nr:hypothetical protein F5882DRAFT_383017 [Hyaloscypha sp. PMI_1271]